MPPAPRVGLTLLALAAALLPCGPAGAEDEALQYVLVLGRSQLLSGPQAYPAFCAEHAGKDRRALRREVTSRLEEIATAGRPPLLEALGNPPDARPVWLLNAVLAHLTAGEIAAARANEAVLAVHPAGLVPAPGKPGTVSQVLRPKRRRPAFSAKGKTIPWHLEALGVPRVWNELGVVGEGVTVASFDFGIDYLHADVRDNVWRNAGEKPNNGRDDDHNGYVDDLYGYDFANLSPEVLDRSPRTHGALTSSCVAGDGSSGTVTGIAPRARLMSLIAHGGAWNAAQAFQYALREGADIVNMSFSIPDLGDARGLWRMMAEHASAAGLVLVSGAGNFQRQARVPVQIRIPEGIPCVICAGGLARDLTVPGFVSLGPVEWGSVPLYGDHPMPEGLVKPDVCAFPGPGIVMIEPGSGDRYLPETNTRRGNSLSAPQVAGVAALMLSAEPRLNPWEVKAILEETARDLEAPGKDPRTGAGLVDAPAAVARVRAARALRPATGR